MTNCTLCKRYDAIFTRLYSGESLCRNCLLKSIEARVRTTIAKYEMLEKNDRIMVAISGGKDSVTLLHILTKIERDYPQANILAVTIDEGIDGYRDDAIKIAEENCSKFGIEHITASFKEKYDYKLDEIAEILKHRKEKGLAPCSYCGVLRRRALNDAAREAGADKLATAHNLDDETQTMILNIIHGDPLRIARVKPVLRGSCHGIVPRIKPFCEVPEKEVALYAYLREINFQVVPCPYAGDALRNDVRTLLNRMEEKHAGMKYTIFRSMERMRFSLEASAEKAEVRYCKICGGLTPGEVCRPCQMLRDLSIA